MARVCRAMSALHGRVDNMRGATGGPTRRRVGALSALVVVVFLGGCSEVGPAGDSSPTPEGVSTQELAQGSDIGPGVTEDHDAPTPVGQVPTWDAQAQATAEQVAGDAVAAWARPDLGYQQWWAGFSPFLSWQGQEAFETVDPANVPASAVTGAAHAEAGESPFLATVTVPTDVGTVEVLLSRQSADEAWLVESIREGES